MDKQQDFIQRPTLDFPAYRESKKPIFFALLGGTLIILAVGLLIWAFALLNQL
jgi:hypothetical protein